MSDQWESFNFATTCIHSVVLEAMCPDHRVLLQVCESTTYPKVTKITFNKIKWEGALIVTINLVGSIKMHIIENYDVSLQYTTSLGCLCLNCP